MILPAAGEDLAGPGTVATPPGRMLGRAAFLPRRLKCQSGPNCCWVLNPDSCPL